MFTTSVAVRASEVDVMSVITITVLIRSTRVSTSVKATLYVRGRLYRIERILNVRRLNSVQRSIRIIACRVRTLRQLARLLGTHERLGRSRHLCNGVLRVDRLTSILTRLRLTGLIIIVAYRERTLRMLRILRLLEGDLTQLRVRRTRLRTTRASRDLEILLRRNVNDLPRNCTTPITRIITYVMDDRTIRLLISRSSQREISNANVLGLEDHDLTGNGSCVVHLITIDVRGLVFYVREGRVGLDRARDEGSIRVPTRLRLRTTEAHLTIRRSARINANRLVLILNIRRPSFALAFILHLLDVHRVTLRKVLSTSSLTFRVNEGRAFRDALVM